MFRRVPCPMARISPAQIMIPGMASSDTMTPERLPTKKPDEFTYASGLKIRIGVHACRKIAVSAMPASTIVRREAPAYNDTKNTNNAEAKRAHKRTGCRRYAQRMRSHAYEQQNEQAGPGIHADDVWAGQRIIQRRLDERTRLGKRSTGQHAAQHARARGTRSPARSQPCRTRCPPRMLPRRSRRWWKSPTTG